MSAGMTTATITPSAISNVLISCSLDVVGFLGVQLDHDFPDVIVPCLDSIERGKIQHHLGTVNEFNIDWPRLGDLWSWLTHVSTGS